MHTFMSEHKNCLVRANWSNILLFLITDNADEWQENIAYSLLIMVQSRLLVYLLIIYDKHALLSNTFQFYLIQKINDIRRYHIFDIAFCSFL